VKKKKKKEEEEEERRKTTGLSLGFVHLGFLRP